MSEAKIFCLFHNIMIYVSCTIMQSEGGYTKSFKNVDTQAFLKGDICVMGSPDFFLVQIQNVSFVFQMIGDCL